MSNNTPDYKDNLVFEPKQMDIEECIAKIGSQDELTGAGGRQSDVLIQAIEKCEKLEKKLKIAVDALKKYYDGNWWYGYEWQEDTDGWEVAEKALEQIKELDK